MWLVKIIGVAICYLIAFISLASADDAAISRLINQGQFAQARAILEAQQPNQLDMLFFDARLLKAQGRLAEAIALFRYIIAQNPDYINARRELAHSLLLAGALDTAQFHFEGLLETDSNETMRAGYRQFLLHIASRQPTGISGHFSVLPSTNITRGTEALYFDTTIGQFVIDPSSRAASGLGFSAGVSGYIHQALNDKNRLTTTWGLSTLQYPKIDNRAVQGDLALRIRHTMADAYLTYGPFVRSIWRQDDADYKAYGLYTELEKNLSLQDKVSLSWTHERRYFSAQSHNNGPLNTLGASISRQIAVSLGVTQGIIIESHTPVNRHSQFSGFRLFSGVDKSWRGGLHSAVRLEWGHRSYNGVFPLTSLIRKDLIRKVSLSLYHGRIDIKGFTPRIGCSYTLNRSNIAFHDHSATECDMSITRNF